MSRLPIVLVFALVACKERAEPTPRPPLAKAPAVDPLGLPPGAPPQLAPPPGPLPPPADGFVRLPYYDLDVEVGEAVVHGHNAVAFDRGCFLAIDVTPNLPPFVGTLGVRCQTSGRDAQDRPRTDCGAACKTVVAVPGSTAVEPYPSGAPIIHLFIRPTTGDQIARGANVWSDGTVQFFGPTCTRWRGRRGTLPPARVAEIAAALERSGTLTSPRSRSCDEGTYARLEVRAHGEGMPPYATACPADGVPLPPEIASVAAALGPNPCDVAAPPRTPLPSAATATLTADTTAFPTDPPAFALSYVGGGMSNPSDESVDVWLDGTVRFAGFACKEPRRATLPTERVTALLAALEQRAVLDAGIINDDMRVCCDCEKTSLELRHGAKHARLIKPGCNNSATYGFSEARALVSQVVGPNPCGRSGP